MKPARLVLALMGSLVLVPCAARPLAVEDVPEPLRPWVSWVLHDRPRAACPLRYDSAAQRRCAWPTQLELALTERGGSFKQRWIAFAEEWVALPGSVERWPQEVTVDGAAALVTERHGVPMLHLPRGTHTASGRFRWERLPESLRLPPESGLVSARVNDRPQPFPDIDTDGRLWLRERPAAGGAREGVRNALEVRVFRRIVDAIPLQVTTRLELEVSGEPRQLLLGPALLPGFIPLALDSPLPARLEADGRLKIQVRPGRHTVHFTARHPRPVDAIPAPPAQAPWPVEEIWVFEARNHLRLVSVEGVPSIDPRQTRLPAEWRRLPAYRVRPGDTLNMRLKRRGDPDPEPDRLSLARTLWLDFAGDGYTVQDKISGTMSSSWRLEVNPPLALGRVEVDGRPQFITRRAGSQRDGVELRRGTVNLIADSRHAGPVSRWLAAGWAHDFQRLSARLQLPPGWRLLAASGVDRVAQSWLSRWTLLDLFLVLIIAGAVAKLWGWRWAAPALLTLALVYHERAAPVQIWLHILAAVALLRVLPPGRIRALVGLYRAGSLVALAVIAIPFAVHQVRIALYPQLEMPRQTLGVGAARVAARRVKRQKEQAVAVEQAPTPVPLQAPAAPPIAGAPKTALKRPGPPGRGLRARRHDPTAHIQTGPGLPNWRWRSVKLSWSGPVERDQEIGLVLLSPAVNLVLRLLSVALLAVLALRVMDLRYTGRGRFGLAAGKAAVLGLATCLLYAGTPGTSRAELPSDALLDQLRDRLLEPPDCLPRCAQVPRMRITLASDTLRLDLEAHALAAVAVPLPGRRGQWEPRTVRVNGEPADGLYRGQRGHLWVRLERGTHRVELEGPAPQRNRFQLSLPLKPHRVETQVTGWNLEGVHPGGLVDPQLQLTRTRSGAAEAALPALEPETLPAFVQVHRTLDLGLEWQVHTQVVRRSPPGTAVVLEVPLLSGESVTSPGVRVEHDKVLLSMAPGQSRFQWRSVLEKAERIVLAAPETTAWAEIWRVDASPIWHLEATGIPVVHHRDRGRRRPTWRPWPGESVTLAVTRPQGVEGKTLTIESSALTLKPGRRATDVALHLSVRSSQGAQHTLQLPEGVRLQSVTINGRSQPIRLEGRSVTLPVTPGSQQIKLAWRDPGGLTTRFGTPGLDIGTDSVNATLQVQVPRGRWVLLAGGPRNGPAVLFWGVLIVLAVVAAGLGRTGLTPLKGRHWMLLGVGLSQIPIYLGVVVAGWLFALSARRRLPGQWGKWRFNAVQVGLALLTLAALGLLFFAVQKGLLGQPEMQIAGNGSSGSSLRWFQDRAASDYPQAWVLSLPILVYRLLMLAWAVWLALALIRWLRWAWECYSTGGIWRALELTRRREKGKPPRPQPAPEGG